MRSPSPGWLQGLAAGRAEQGAPRVLAAHRGAWPNRALWLQVACTLLVTLGAAYASYRHGHEFAVRFGADATTSAIWPLIVDGLLTTATVEL